MASVGKLALLTVTVSSLLFIRKMMRKGAPEIVKGTERVALATPPIYHSGHGALTRFSVSTA